MVVHSRLSRRGEGTLVIRCGHRLCAEPESDADICWMYRLGSRYIYDLYYEKQAISKQLYDWLLKNNYADANLIAKWKKQGYEKVSWTSHYTALQDPPL